MRFLQDGNFSGYSEQFQIKLGAVSDTDTISRLKTSAWTSPLFYASALYFTLLLKTHQTESVIFGIWLLVLCLAQLLATHKFAQSSAWKTPAWAISFATSFSWGCFCSRVIYVFSLSWTTFFTLLLTLAISASMIPLFFAKIKMLFYNLTLLLAPTFVSCWFLISGQHGFAIGAFLSAYGIFIWTVGKRQNVSYWSTMISSARMKAIVDSLPGTLAWFNSELKYLGANERHRNLWKLSPDFLHQQPTIEPDLADHCRQILRSKKEVSTVEEIQGKSFYLVGQTYNWGEEGLLMGIDVTGQQQWQKELQKGRLLTLRDAKITLVGRLFQMIAFSVARPSEGTYFVKLLGGIVGPGNDKSTTVSTSKFMGVLEKFFQPFCKESAIQFEVTTEQDAKILISKPDLFLVMASIVLNAIDATASCATKKIMLRSGTDGDFATLSVYDSGPGVDPLLEDVIFEPFVSTKENHAGMGLSLSQEVCKSYSGLINYRRENDQTCFQVRIPTIPKS
mgnify:CR=1 FL=1